MNKSVLSLIGGPILLNQEKAIVGVLKDFVIHPENGNFLGILIYEGYGKKNLKAVSIKDIVGMGSNFFVIDGYESIGEIEDIVRIHEIVKREIKIVGNHVVTVAGRRLGKVYDFEINFDINRLAKILVKPRMSIGIEKELRIDVEQIISIEKDQITVEDSVIKIGKGVKVIGTEPGSI